MGGAQIGLGTRLMQYVYTYMYVYGEHMINIVISLFAIILHVYYVHKLFIYMYMYSLVPKLSLLLRNNSTYDL